LPIMMLLSNVIRVAGLSATGKTKAFLPILRSATTNIQQPAVATASSAGKRKRFYKSTSIVSSDGGTFEVCLDHRKLRTPKGIVVRIPSEPLALAVANEWESQGEILDLSRMHMSGLCITAIDNPWNRNRDELVNEIMKFLDTDTILYIHDESKSLRDVQLQEWGRVVEWINNRFGIDMHLTSGLEVPEWSENSKNTLQNYFLSHSVWALQGYLFVVEALKSVLLGIAVIEHKLSIAESVKLAILEQEFQVKSWGRVEWAHDVEFQEISSRVAAGVLFSHFNSVAESKTSKAKTNL